MKNPRTELTARECAAIRLLYPEWTLAELRMCFMINEESVRLHARGECICHVGGRVRVGDQDAEFGAVDVRPRQFKEACNDC